MSRRTTAYLYLLLVSIIWGAASPVVKHTLQWFDPWLFLTYRFAISTIIAIPYLTLTGVTLPKKASHQWLLFLTGLVSAPISLFLFFAALDKTTALSGSLITAAGPLFLILGGVLFFRDRVTKYEKIGIGVALFGTLLTVIGPLILNGHSDTLGRLEGNTLMLIAVITDIIGALLSKEAVKKGVNAALVAQSQFVLGFVLFIPLLLMRTDLPMIWAMVTTAPLEAHLGVLFMAIVSGTFAYTIRNIAVKSIEVSESALYSYLQPLWAAVLAVLWLRETITPSYIVGGAIIAIGVVIAEQKRGRQRKR
ncbi:MAG TPA: DMT family transporter [Patescibacteria group bacterium]|nr:DMT family transporter [Patescibacteria group bacterium]